MRIRQIHVRQWRHFENVELSLDNEAGLICIVGANGTGKSHLLELIAACAHRLGLSQGIEIPRGDPFADPHDFSLRFYLAPGVSEAIDKELAANAAFPAWDRTLTIKDCNIPPSTFSMIEAGGIVGAKESAQFARVVTERLRQSQEVHFLSLDADRAYPKKNLNIHEIAQAYEIDWEGTEYTRGRSFRTTTTLYDEWMKYFLAQENQSGTKLIQGIRRAKKAEATMPEFVDHFQEYASSLQKVLPHVFFTGVNSKKRTLLFDTTGLELAFDQLSGGEREIAFLIGQIDRFGLRQGLFLLDEPELHLNADLIRTWVAYLTSTVANGQVWLATHSLEAVEAAGQRATFVLERSETTRKVDSLARLDSRPILSALSRAVGTPAFSISQLLFIFVEGEEGVGERERYRRLAGLPQNVRFMECGSAKEVVRRVQTIKAMAKESEAGIRIGGVIDRDFQSTIEAEELARASGVYALPVHEAENFFLHPPSLKALLEQNGQEQFLPDELIRAAADQRAGSWIFQHAMATRLARSLPEMPTVAKDRAKTLAWSDIDPDKAAAIGSIVRLTRFDSDEQEKLAKVLDVSVSVYARKRVEATFWKECEGKQILGRIAKGIGYADPSSLMMALFAVWGRGQIPDELSHLRKYIETL